MTEVYALSVDPGFASVGYVLARLLSEGEELIAMGTFRTEKATKKQHVLASDDNVRRTREIARALKPVVTSVEHPVRVICIEASSVPRNASTAAKNARCEAVISTLAEVYDLPIAQCSPQQIKKRMGVEKLVSGKTEKEKRQAKALSKDKVQDYLRGIYGVDCLNALLGSLPEGQWEHAYDALAILVTCADSDVMRFARRMST
jgi:Holliday junction resolvasome RuvABC endonuclease subunit